MLDVNCYKSLEFCKVLEMLSKEAITWEAREKILSLNFVNTLDRAQILLDETQSAYSLINHLGAPPFQVMGSEKISVARAKNGGLLTAGELLSIASLLKITRLTKDWRKNAKKLETALDEKFNLLRPDKYLEEKISASILSEDKIADEASPNLMSIRRKISLSSNKIREQLDKMIHSSHYQKYLQEPIVTIRDGRFVVPVKSEHRFEIAGIVHDTSSSGGTVFIEPIAVVKANNEIKVFCLEEQREIEKILQNLSNETGKFADLILSNREIIIKLDIVFAKAKLACIMKANPPKLNQTGNIKLKKARHPLISSKKIVPVDISLGYKFDSLIITGPNTGGKTVAIKILGLFTLMASLGLFILAEDGSEIAIFEQVLVDIGDEQSIEQSLSTFSGHILNVKRIMDRANSKSLILLDELGAGTDPIEGAAIAISILEFLRDAGAKIALTTHYAELKEYAISTNGVENAACEFNTETLCPTYRLIIGAPGRSNAFIISEKLGIKKQVIDRARQIMSSDNKELESVIEKLEEKRKQIEKEQKKLEKLTDKAQKEAKDAEEMREQLQRQNEIFLNSSKEKAKKIVIKAKRQADLLLEELEILKKKKQNISIEDKARLKSQIKNIEEIADPTVERNNEGYKLPREIKKEDRVLIVDIDKEAVVIENPNQAGSVLVQAGIIKTRVNISNLRLLEEKKLNLPALKPVTRNVKSKLDTKLTRELNLCGHTALEAISELDKFIDSAILLGINELKIIHGKGTGVLRKEVHEYLKSHPYIKEFRLGIFGEGETGVTIAQLK
ncbi:MAG: endonuclease MutS2 [Oscillospiraceae bacterium]|jgi:DNA mismatch repair protein MutS2|nr:endonuclease MutS2 [Oscillospiraceae bacterium]